MVTPYERARPAHWVIDPAGAAGRPPFLRASRFRFGNPSIEAVYGMPGTHGSVAYASPRRIQQVPAVIRVTDGVVETSALNVS